MRNIERNFKKITTIFITKEYEDYSFIINSHTLFTAKLCRQHSFSTFKVPVQYFSMQVVMNKYFLLNPEKIWRRSVLSFSRKTQKPLTPTHSNSEKLRHRAEG